MAKFCAISDRLNCISVCT